ncbi:MAG: HD domain-containing protein [Bacteroidales bacterium]|nr:HD domain-containing protein [Bacteroidales bacterium]
MMEETLVQFVESAIIPRYAAFDKAHREDHARQVIDRALDLAAHYPVDVNIVYAAAACHDLGLSVDRKTHHLESGRIIREMQELRSWFDAAAIELIAQAAEDHRASSDHEPRSIYGRIVAEADRLIDPEQILRRTIQFGLSHYPELPREGHWERTLEHLHEKYADGGYLKLWIPESPNAARLEELRAIIRDEAALRAYFDRIYEEEK